MMYRDLWLLARLEVVMGLKVEGRESHLQMCPSKGNIVLSLSSTTIVLS